MDETRRLIGLVLAGGVLLFAVTAAVAIYHVRGGDRLEPIRLESRPMASGGGTSGWRTSAPASQEDPADSRVTIRSFGEDEPSSWNFASQSEDTAAYSFDDLWGSRTSTTAAATGSRWRPAGSTRRWNARERWRPTGIDGREDGQDSSGGWERREETLEERIEAAGLDLSTPSGKLERACLLENHSRYACRCVVREAIRMLSPGEIDFITRAEQGEPPATRLRAAGLGLDALPGMAVRLVSLDAATQRYCGAGFTL